MNVDACLTILVLREDLLSEAWRLEICAGAEVDSSNTSFDTSRCGTDDGDKNGKNRYR